MRIPFTLITLLITGFSFAQMRPLEKVYAIEGIVADLETMQGLPSAILYNDSLGITTTSDANGYFKIVVPYQLIKDRQMIPIDILKTGYKRNGSGFTFNPVAIDSGDLKADNTETWDYNAMVFLMAKNSSQANSTVEALTLEKKRLHGYASVRQALDEAINMQLTEKKFDQLKEGDDLVYFSLDNAIGLATSRYDIIVIGKLTFVYINDKKVNLADINKLVKRSGIIYDRSKSDALSKKYGKETLAFATAPLQETTKDNARLFKATLFIEADN